MTQSGAPKKRQSHFFDLENPEEASKRVRERWGPSPHAKRLMRLWRAACVLIVTALALAIWAATFLHNQRFVHHYSYVEADGVQLDTYACDVWIVPADAPTVTVEFIGNRFLSRVTPAVNGVDSFVLRQAKFHNLDGCFKAPYVDCSRRCLITIGVSPGAANASFDVFQDPSDTKSFPNLYVKRGARLGTLRVGDWFAKVPSMSVYLRPGALVGQLTTALVDGFVYYEGSSVGADGIVPQLFEDCSHEGWELAQPDRERLMSTYGARYGDSDSDAEAFFTFDMTGGPGTPSLRFLYATNLAHLALMPSDLRLVSGGLIEPFILQEQIRMRHSGCNASRTKDPLPGPDEMFSQLETAGFNTTALPARTSAAQSYARAAFKELEHALHSRGEADTTQLRGSLILLGNEVDYWGNPTMFVFQRAAGEELLLRRWRPTSERKALLTAAILAAIFGVVCGSAATYLLFRLLHVLARDAYRSKCRQALLQAQRAGMPGHLASELVNGIGEDLRPPHPSPSLVLYSIFTVIDDLIIRPLRLRVAARNSVRGFCSDRVQLCCPGGVYGATAASATSISTASSARRLVPEELSDGQPSQIAIRRAHSRPFATLDAFMAQYSLYCLEKDIEPLLLDEVLKEIKSARVGLAVHQYTARQVRGLKWKSEAEVAEAVKSTGYGTESLKDGVVEDEAEAVLKMADIQSFPRAHIHVLVEFIRLHCNPGLPSDSIDIEDRPLMGGNAGTAEVELGLASRFSKWQREVYPDVRVQLEGHVWTKVLPPPARYVDGVRMRMVCGGTWREPTRDNDSAMGCAKFVGPPGINGMPSASWYGFTLVATIIHFAIVLLPIFALLLLTMRVQDMWALTMAPPTVGGRRPQVIYVAFQPSPLATVVGLTSSEVYLRPLVQAAVIESGVFLVFTICRALLHYAELSQPRRASRPYAWAFLHYIRLCYAVLAALHVAIFLSMGSMAACWFVLGAALEPIRFLAYGTAVITLFISIYYVATSIVALADRTKRSLTLRIHTQLATQLRHARLRISRCKLTEQLVNCRENNDPSSAEAVHAELQQLGQQERALAQHGARLENGDGKLEADEVDAEEIFKTLDVDGSGTLTLNELEALFDELDLPISERYKRSMFAQLDIESDGTVSVEEFRRGWDDMIGMIVEHGLINAGLTTLQIVAAILTLTTLVSLLIAFIIVALSGWPRQSLDSAVIESILVAGVGVAAKNRSKWSIETEKAKLDGLVQGTVTATEASLKSKAV